jgi:hypothetical protein
MNVLGKVARRLLAPSLLLATVAVALSGCLVAPAGPPYAYVPGPYLAPAPVVVVPAPPPVAFGWGWGWPRRYWR